MSEELKPCPFCGGDASLYSNWKHDPERRYYWATCDNYDCMVECFTDNDHYSEESAAKVWNTRHIVEIEAVSEVDAFSVFMRGLENFDEVKAKLIKALEGKLSDEQKRLINSL